MEQQKVLMVCAANICRSPIAEGLFVKLVKERGEENKWIVDSAGVNCTSVGESPSPRSQKIMEKYHIPYNNTSRSVKESDFNNFDYIFGMDESNIIRLKNFAPKVYNAKIQLLGDFLPEGDKIIRDPFDDIGSEGFETCYDQCLKSIINFLDQFKENKL